MLTSRTTDGFLAPVFLAGAVLSVLALHSVVAPILACLAILLSGLAALSGLKSERMLAKIFAAVTVVLIILLRE